VDGGEADTAQRLRDMNNVPGSEDRRLWWQKLADGIGETLAGLLQFLIAGWEAWNWRSRWFWGNRDDL
jgi:hypothetical protein